MAVFKCKMCGGNLQVMDNQSVAVCEYCSTRQTLPRLDNEKKIALFTRANNLRIKSEFDKAAGIYESIIAEFRDESEAYWGLVLCKYGIEYVDDGKGRKIPTCHRTLPVSIMDDDDFEQACEYADLTAKNLYREEAKAIDGIQKKILNIAVNEEPYDIFICYKETDDVTGTRTEDSLIAQDIYTQLIKDGYKVFFSRVTLREVAGTEYEPYIYAALSSAKIMLAIGTKYAYYDAVWVKNEWSRFISMMSDDGSKVLIPCYRNMDAYDMPKEFRNMQALDMGDVTFFGSLMENVERIVDKPGKKATKETVVINGNDDVEPLLERGFMSLEDREWERADQFFEAVLNKDPKNARAYLGKLMVAFSVTRFEDLDHVQSPLNGNNNYEKILRFADEEMKGSIKRCNDIVVRRCEETRKKDLYENALEIMQNATTEEMFENAGYMFLEVKDYHDAKQKSDECFEKAELARIREDESKREQYYNSACAILGSKSTELSSFEYAVQIFESLDGWRDSKEKAHLGRQRIADIKKMAEVQRQEAERKAEEARQLAIKRKKRNKKIGIIAAACVAVITCFAVLFVAFLRPMGIYNDAVELQEQGEYYEAYMWFNSISYLDSKERAEEIYKLAKEQQLSSAQIGDYVSFGSYEQDNDAENGKEGIEWQVIDKQDNRVLVISALALECKPYNTEYMNVTWENCSLRQWLNNDFLNEAFSEQEKAMIPTVMIADGVNYGYGTESGRVTQDKVFLLSMDEVSGYAREDSERMCLPSFHAVVNGVYEDEYNGNCWWWLRTPGMSEVHAAQVDCDGKVSEKGSFVNYDNIGVRPAMWIEIG